MITCSGHYISQQYAKDGMRTMSTLVLYSLLLLSSQGCVLADYLFEMRLHNYLNPTHRQANEKCCGNDNLLSCEDDCNNTLKFCLRPINFTTASTTAKCPLGNFTVSGIDDGFVYNQSGVNNDQSDRLAFTGYSWSGSLQLLVEVVNVHVDDENELVDVINIDGLLLSPGEGFSDRLDFHGIYQIGSLEMSFRVMCIGNFSGPTCTSECVGDDCVNICEELMPCQNGGTCISTGNEGYRCMCSNLYDALLKMRSTDNYGE